MPCQAAAPAPPAHAASLPGAIICSMMPSTDASSPLPSAADGAPPPLLTPGHASTTRQQALHPASLLGNLKMRCPAPLSVFGA